MFADKADAVRIKLPRTRRCFYLRMVLDLGCGTKLLTCGYSALALAATKYRSCYASTFAIDHETRLVLCAQKIRAVNLAPSHHHAHRKRYLHRSVVLFASSGSVRSTFKNRPAQNTAVADKSLLNFGGPLLPKPWFDSSCFEYWDECRVPRKAIKADGKNHARRGRGL